MPTCSHCLSHLLFLVRPLALLLLVVCRVCCSAKESAMAWRLNTHTNRFPRFHKSWNTPPALPSHLWILVPNRAPAAQLALTDASVPAILQAILHRLIWHHFGVSQQRTGGSFITKPESHAWGERCKSRTCFKSVSWGNISSTKGRKWHRGPLFLHGCGSGPQIKVYEHVKFLHVSLRFMVLVINGMVLFHHLIVYKFSVANLLT